MEWGEYWGGGGNRGGVRVGAVVPLADLPTLE